MELVGFLSHSNAWWRDTAVRLLLERDDDAVAFALKGALDPNSQVNDLLAGKPGRLAYPPLNHYPTPTGKLSFTALKTDPQPVTTLPEEIKINGRSDYFLLLGRSHPHYTHSQFQDVYGPIPATAAIHPDDAKALDARCRAPIR